MGQGHDYFEIGELDIFSGKARCLPSPICLLSLTSDGSGVYPGWYVNYVEVTMIRVGAQYCVRQHFNVEQWLAPNDLPTDLTVVRNNCPKRVSLGVGHENPKFLLNRMN